MITDYDYPSPDPCIPQFCYIKVGFKGVYTIWTCFRDGLQIGMFRNLLTQYQKIEVKGVETIILGY